MVLCCSWSNCTAKDLVQAAEDEGEWQTGGICCGWCNGNAPITSATRQQKLFDLPTRRSVRRIHCPGRCSMSNYADRKQAWRRHSPTSARKRQGIQTNVQLSVSTVQTVPDSLGKSPVTLKSLIECCVVAVCAERRLFLKVYSFYVLLHDWIWI